MRIVYLGQRFGATGTPVGFESIKVYNAYVDERVGIFAVNFSGTVNPTTVKLQGRLNSTCAYTDIATVLSSDTEKAKTVVMLPDMRMFVTVMGSNTFVDGYIGI